MLISFHELTRAACLLVAMGLVLAGCSADDDDESVTSTQEEDAEPTPVIRRTVPFITLRNKTGSDVAAEFFGGERGTRHTGYCDVTWTPIAMLQPIAESAPFYIPSSTMQLESVIEVDELDFWRDPVDRAVADHPLLYVHGYNIGFEKGCGRAALFQENLQLGCRFLLFSWPSDDNVLKYTRDEADLYWSVAYIEQTLQQMIDVFGTGSVDVVGHSLGTRGIYLALVRLGSHYDGSLPLLNNLVLVAADIDSGIFRQYLELVRPLARHVTVYVSDNDNALTVSEEVHGYPRLGRAGSHLQGLEGIEIIDVSATGRQRASGHLYHLHNPVVIRDLDGLINAGLLARERPGLSADPSMGPGYFRLQPPAEE